MKMPAAASSDSSELSDSSGSSAGMGGSTLASLHGGGEPSRWVRHWAHLVAPGGAVLDVACGAGRHARFFASRGHPVTAIDRDCAALATLRAAPLIAPAITTAVPAPITTLNADLEGAAWPLPPDAKFAAVVVTNYLHRPLFPQLMKALAPGGVLVYETFAKGNGSVGKPSNPAFLLTPGELLDVVRGHLRVVAFQDGFLAQPRPAYVQRICAILEAERSAESTQAAPPPCYELAG